MRIHSIKGLISNRDISFQLILRETRSRYKGSKLGLAWTAINPAIMICIYTLIFSQVFKARWHSGDNEINTLDYGLNIFCGLIIFNIFAECATRSPSIIRNNPNFVKKIIFPLHTLGTMITGSAIIHGMISICILLATCAIINGFIPQTSLLLPLIWMPMILGCVGLTWMISTIGVFIKDIDQIMNAIVSMMMFLSPIFYPSSALPESFKWVGNLNPLTITIENTRAILLKGELISGGEWLINTILMALWCELCYRVLDKSKKYFADEL